MKVIDLRSDTVTKPTPAMRDAMARAEVGDDVYGEDPTVNELEARVAAMLGKERALFVPSGTMANQLAILVQTRRGDEVIIGEGAHSAEFESGGAAAWGGVQFAIAGRGGLFDAADLDKAFSLQAYYRPRTSLVAVENTHNLSGGRVFPSAQAKAVADRASALGLGRHLDGARLWNAAAATGLGVLEMCAGFDTVSVCFSKGLGAPVGSALAGPRDLMVEAHRLRKMMGGGMRQAGILAAAALYALDHHLERLELDHRSARAVAEVVAAARGASVDLASVETNMVNIRLTSSAAARVKTAAEERGVLVGAMGPRLLRAVTHLDVSLDEAREAAARLAEAIESCSV